MVSVGLALGALAASPNQTDILRATIEAVAPGSRFVGAADAFTFTGRFSGTTETTGGGWTIRRSDGSVFRLISGGSGFHIEDTKGRMIYSIRADGNGWMFVPASKAAPVVRAARVRTEPSEGRTGWSCDGQLLPVMQSAPPDREGLPRARAADLGELFDRKYESRQADRRK